MFSFRELGTVEASHRVGLPKRTPGGGGGETETQQDSRGNTGRSSSIYYTAKKSIFRNSVNRALTDTAYRYSRACSNNIAR